MFELLIVEKELGSRDVGEEVLHMAELYITCKAMLQIRIRCFFTPWIRDKFFPDPG
jgi:hypothetical protein